MKLGDLRQLAARFKALKAAGKSPAEANLHMMRTSVAKVVAKRYGLTGERFAGVIMPKKSDPSRPQTGDARVSTNESTNPRDAAAQMGRTTGRAVEEAVTRIERMEDSLTEGIEGLETDVVGALRRMEDHLFQDGSGYNPPARSPAPATIDDQEEYQPKPKSGAGVGGSWLKKLLPYLEEGGAGAGIWGALRGFGGRAIGALGGAEVLGPVGLTLGGYEIGKNFVPSEKEIDKRRKRRDEIRNSPGVFHQAMTGLWDMLTGSEEQTGNSKQIKGRSVAFTARRIEFKFDRVSGLSSGATGAVQSQEDESDFNGDAAGDSPQPSAEGPSSQGMVSPQSSPGDKQDRLAEPHQASPVDRSGGVKNPPPSDGKLPISGDLTEEVGFGHKFGDINKVNGLIVHHTGSRGTPESIVNTFKQRGYPAQYIMDRDGNVFRALPEGAQGRHMMKGWGKGEGLSNANTEGIEVIAKDNNDLTDAQKAAVGRFIVAHSRKYGYDPLKEVFGHGEVNPGHKMADEGLAGIDYFREHYQELEKQYDKSGVVAPVIASRPGSVAPIPGDIDRGDGSGLSALVNPAAAKAPSAVMTAPPPSPPVPADTKRAPKVVVNGGSSSDNSPDDRDLRSRKRNKFYKGDKEDRDEVTFSQYMNVEHDEGVD